MRLALLLIAVGIAAQASPIFTASGVMCIDSRGHCGEPGFTHSTFSFTATLYECPSGICGSTNYGCVTETFELAAHGASWECWTSDMFHDSLRRLYEFPLPTVDLSNFPTSAYMTAPFGYGAWNVDAVYGGRFADVDHGSMVGTFSIADNQQSAQSAPIHNPEPGTWVMMGLAVVALVARRSRTALANPQQALTREELK